MKIIEDLIRDKVQDHIKAYIDTELIDEKIKAAVEKELKVVTKKVLLYFLGFDQDSLGRKLRIDHYNGRSGNSPLGDILKSRCSQVLKAWLDKNLGKVSEYEMPETMQKEIEKNIEQKVLTSLNKLDDTCRVRANELLNRIMAKIDEVPKVLQ